MGVIDKLKGYIGIGGVEPEIDEMEYPTDDGYGTDYEPEEPIEGEGYEPEEEPEDRINGNAAGSNRNYQNGNQQGVGKYANGGNYTSTANITNIEDIKSRKAKKLQSTVMYGLNPTCFDDVAYITEALKNECQIVLNLQGMDYELANSIYYYALGTCAALCGNIRRISENVFIIGTANCVFTGCLGEDGNNSNINNNVYDDSYYQDNRAAY